MVYPSYHHMGFPKSWDSWMVHMENPKIKWMMTGGTPMTGNIHIPFETSFKLP
jgi:hypothetical protein